MTRIPTREEWSPVRELEDALRVAPSPEFAARVRARVAGLPTLGDAPMTGWAGWRASRSWGVALGGVAAMAVMAVAFRTMPVASPPTASTLLPGGPVVSQAEIPTVAGLVEIGESPAPLPAPRSGFVGAARAPAVARTPATPLVLVSGDEARALDRFLVTLGTGTLVVPEFNPKVDQETGELLLPDPLVMPPIVDVVSLPVVRDGAAGRKP
jgi:hypothetical protein